MLAEPIFEFLVFMTGTVALASLAGLTVNHGLSRWRNGADTSD